MSSKKETIVCFCEDITEEEIVNAIKEGFTTPVDIKNYLRTGMGPCQGRGCSSQIIRLIRQVTGQSPQDIIPLSTRPPITPVPIGVLKKITRQEGGMRR
jgi:bacterioferritin-associated ferredoxin